MTSRLFSEEHDALRDSIRRWVEREADEAAPVWERSGGFPLGLVGELGAMGWFTAMAGDDAVAGLVVAEELGRIRSAGTTAALLGHAHAGAVLSRAGDAHGNRAAAALAGEQTLCLVDGALAATPTSDGWVVFGAAPAVVGAAGAETALLVSQDDDGPVLALAETSAPGWSATRPVALHGRRGGHVADVTLTDFAVPVSGTVATGARAAALLGELRAWRRVHGAAAAVSAAWRAWDDARDYALQREAFGRPIAKFQVNRHALAEMAGELEAARCLVRETAHRLGRGLLAAGDTAALWLWGADVANRVTDRCLQLHGGYGYTTEFDVGRAWRDARMLRTDHSGEDALREELATALEART